MKKFSHSGKTRRLMLLISCLAVICMLYSPSLSGAEEAHRDVSQLVSVEEKRLEGMQLTRMYEDRMLIEGKEYIVTDRTKIYRKDNNNKVKTTKISEIVLPCLVDITYRTYSAYTEEAPFYPDERILASVFIKKGNVEFTSQ